MLLREKSDIYQIIMLHTSVHKYDQNVYLYLSCRIDDKLAIVREISEFRTNSMHLTKNVYKSHWENMPAWTPQQIGIPTIYWLYEFRIHFVFDYIFHDVSTCYQSYIASNLLCFVLINTITYANYGCNWFWIFLFSPRNIHDGIPIRNFCIYTSCMNHWFVIKIQTSRKLVDAILDHFSFAMSPIIAWNIFRYASYLIFSDLYIQIEYKIMEKLVSFNKYLCFSPLALQISLYNNTTYKQKIVPLFFDWISFDLI